MKQPRTGLIISIASLALLALLSLQVYYVLRSAAEKEENFKQSVNMALCKVADEVCSDRNACANWESCCMAPEEGSATCTVNLSEKQRTAIDSLLKYYMEYYHIDLDYNFEIVKAEGYYLPSSKGQFEQKLNAGLAGNYQLMIHFPNQRQFIMSELKGIFLSSILLTLILIVLFYFTIRALVLSSATLQRTTDFVNNMTHELNTPIANISLATGRLSKENLSEEKKQNYLAILKSETERLRSNVERLLDVSCLDKEGYSEKKIVFDVRDVIANAASSIEMNVAQKHGKIVIENNAVYYHVEGDQMHIQNAIQNLLDNALKYSKEKPEIRVHTYNENDNIAITITDKGIGIPVAEQKKIFERYYRVPSGDTHDVKGFGIGLNYVMNVARKHKGTVTVRSTIGTGSTFTLFLPIVK